MNDDEKMTFKSYSTFMKLHGWERLDIEEDTPKETKKKVEETKKNWIIGE